MKSNVALKDNELRSNNSIETFILRVLRDWYKYYRSLSYYVI